MTKSAKLKPRETDHSLASLVGTLNEPVETEIDATEVADETGRGLGLDPQIDIEVVEDPIETEVDPEVETGVTDEATEEVTETGAIEDEKEVTLEVGLAAEADTENILK